MENTLLAKDLRTEELVQENKNLHTQVLGLNQQVLGLNQQVLELSVKLKWYEEQFKLNTHRKYGRSSEKIIDGQISLFNEAEIESNTKVVEPTIEEITYKRKKREGKREEQLSDLPVETVRHSLPKEEQICKNCDGELHVINTEVRQELKIIPAQVVLVKHEKEVYGCRNCEKNETSVEIITAPMPNPVIPGSLASPSSVAHIMTQKYVDGLPLYRQEKQLERIGVEISRQTLANWMIECSERWLEGIYSRMKEHLLSKDILHADETELQVLHEEGRLATSTSYMWMYRTGKCGPPIILYDYKTTRAGKHPINFLKGFSGYLHVDGYPGYNGLENVVLVGCWAHARRKFDEALKALPKDKANVPVAARDGLNYCNKLFMIERELRELTDEERYNQRLERSKPIVDEFFAWLKYHSPRVLPKSAFSGAINYCLNQWDKLKVFLLDGRLELDNNRSERTIKPFVIGRKNWLFANSVKGAKASSTIYSIIETAKENGLNPFEYLKYLFERLPNITVKGSNSFDDLLPWSTDVPNYCKIHKSI